MTRDTSGVSPAWAAFGVVTNSAWILSLVAQRLWAPAFAPALAFVTYGSLLAVMGRIGFGDRWAVLATAYAGSLTVVEESHATQGRPATLRSREANGAVDHRHDR